MCCYCSHVTTAMPSRPPLRWLLGWHMPHDVVQCLSAIYLQANPASSEITGELLGLSRPCSIHSCTAPAVHSVRIKPTEICLTRCSPPPTPAFSGDAPIFSQIRVASCSRSFQNALHFPSFHELEAVCVAFHSPSKSTGPALVPQAGALERPHAG